MTLVKKVETTIVEEKKITEPGTEKADNTPSSIAESNYQFVDKERMPGAKEQEATTATINPALYPLNILSKTITGEHQQLLAKIVSIVKHKVFTAEAVIYLGALTTKPDQSSAVYLLVIVSNDEKKQGHEPISTVEERCKLLASVMALVHSAGIFLKAAQ